ncbi:hypothetical protein KCMC57_64490 (plasmid) [Kitasatospora sp. CMC57]|uniref:Uncharacterized protein n=1 Tax=Kitasatospora sp. CMC57 TaxID=3231513 RepID=A0AB33K859_9ACTN
MSDEMPSFPLTQLAQSASAMHEMFVAQVAAGFTEAQALYLVACMVSGGPREQR